MKRLRAVAVILLLLAAAVPVQAFTAENLTISIGPGGNAAITFSYKLNWLEYLTVFIRITDPAAELKKVLEGEFHQPVTIREVTAGRVSLDVPGFAVVQKAGDSTRYTTPELSFAGADQILRQQWFAGLVSPDFSPAITVVRFPDGHEERFADQETIPAIRYVIGP
jgi:hypothetical protein